MLHLIVVRLVAYFPLDSAQGSIMLRGKMFSEIQRDVRSKTTKEVSTPKKGDHGPPLSPGQFHFRIRPTEPAALTDTTLCAATRQVIEFYYVWKLTSHYDAWKKRFEKPPGYGPPLAIAPDEDAEEEGAE